ncbi:MAG: TraX family protein [Acutalibacteraceae bacterium]
MEKRTNGLSAYQLKIIAVAAMLTDHLAWAFVSTASFEGQLMHTVGRLATPIMCMLIAEGYHHTRNLKKYVIRMAVFAAVSAFAYSFFESGGHITYKGMGVIYTLLLGLISIIIWNTDMISTPAKVLSVALLCVLSLQGDWPIMGVLWPLCFAVFRDNKKAQIISFLVIAILEAVIINAKTIMHIPELWWAKTFQFGVLFVIPILMLYNGKLGGRRGGKWFFYIFYPAHLLALGLIVRFIK